MQIKAYVYTTQSINPIYLTKYIFTYITVQDKLAYMYKQICTEKNTLTNQ